ncbi:hypothetical protein P389DRAFT_150262 [Cystobasidium minutum MCA 4210]|uniref:uncharacterized protein n=1 Tax=Cystobasidium minutum MCA 4210 TaxID=1397322 RepID=UPI0034CFFFD7|eukprot:jgi/Rhomi1/150262/estExt_Genewise1.C_2_t30035
MDAISSMSDETIVRMVGIYHWNRQILKTLASAVASREPLSPPAARDVYTACKEGLLSDDSTIRHSVLVLLERQRDSSAILKEALETERVPLTPQDARDKNMHLRRMGIALKAVEASSEDFETGLLYSFAMLKVNFKPLWSEAIDVIAEASRSKTDGQNLIWDVLLKQLRLVAQHNFKETPESSDPKWALGAAVSPADSSMPPWRQHDLACTAYARMSGKFGASCQQFAEVAGANERTLSAHVINDQLSNSRLSFINFEAQLLALCARLNSLTEKHSRDFLDLFFRQFGQDEFEVNDGIGGKAGRERLSNWLKVVSSFKNPKALYRSEDLYERMLHLLSHGDSTIQGLVLDCILTWKSPALQAYETNLRNMLTSTYLRDELLQFSLAEDSSDIMPERREQVVNITIRLLFGLMSSHQGRASAINVQRSRKSAIINALKACRPEDLHVLVQLMVSSFQEQAVLNSGTFTFSPAPRASASQQLGFLTLLGDIIQHLADKVREHWGQLFQVTINLAYHSRPSHTSGERARHVRQLAFRRMSDFFKADSSFDAVQYLPSVFRELITPRLSQFGAENAQGPSALMEVISTWAAHSETAFILVRYDHGLLPALYSTISTSNVKTPVTICVLDVIQKILHLSEDSEDIKTELLEPFMGELLSSISTLLATRASALSARDQIGLRLISILSSISPFIAGRQYTEQLLPLLLPLLSKPNALIPENIKTDVLRIIEKLLSDEAASQLKSNESLLEQCYRTVCNLFATVRGRAGRVQTLSVFRKLQVVSLPGSDVADLLDELNAFSIRRMDVPDFDRRLAAFQNLNERKYSVLKPTEWVPVLANMFYFIQDPEELSIRSNANAALRRFVEVASSSLDPGCRTVFSKNFLPALKRALRSKVDLVRIESMAVLQTAVQANTGFAELDEMKCLLAGDEEASFFVNVYHIQTHRRARALRRLSEEAQAGSLSSKTINEIFLPLVAYNLSAATESKAQEVVNETVTTIGRLSSVLQWSAYNRLLQQYFASAAEKRDNQKLYVRVLVAILKAFSFDLTSTSSPEIPNIMSSVEKKLLPRLLQFLQSRNETEELLRIPIAEGVAVIVQHLPEDHRAADVTNLITALAQILRSKSQEVRDMTRSTMVNIAVSLGPEYLPIFFKELRASLAKGPHLHVLAFVAHVLLERVLGAVPDANIDECLGDAVPVVYDDLLGFPAKDRESSEFRSKTKYREVRLCKSLDSIELLATHVSPNKINSLLGPLKGVLADNDSMKVMQTVDDILRRIASGILKNRKLDNTILLTLSQALISQNTNFLKPRKPKGKKESQASKEYQVQMKRITHATSDSYALNAHKFVAFGLDLLNGAFKKNRFDLHDPETVSRLDPLITLVGNTLFAEEAHVLDRALRAVASLIKCPLTSIERAAPVLAKQMISILENMGGTASDLSQTTIRSLATLIRDRKTLVLSEDQLSTLVAIISPDLEEPEQQAALFSLLRAIVSRKFASPEVYDLMDRVAEILIASQSYGTREICRSIYLQFLLDYPQGKKRLSTSLQFLAKNLGGYLHESGRLSALELVNAILSKFGSDLLDQYADLFHVSLVMDLANDESAKCRAMAAENCKVLYAHVSAAVRQRLVDAIVTWGSQAENLDLQKVAAQTSGVLIEAFKGKGQVEGLIQQVLPTLITMVNQATSTMDIDAEAEAEEYEDDTASSKSWQSSYHALASLYKILSSNPSSVNTLDATFRKSLRSMLIFPHTWVRQAACRLLGITFSLMPKSLSLEELIDAASGMTMQLQSKHLEDSLALQIVKNLFFIGKQFAQLDQNAAAQQEDASEDAEAEDEKEIEEAEEPQDGNVPSKKSPQSNPLHWLFVKLSHRARVAHQTKPSMYALGNRLWKWSIEPMSILRWFAAMISEESVSAENLQKQLHQILLPVVRIVEDPNGAKDPQMDDLQALAREVQEMLANRLGISPVTEAYSKIQRNMAVKREGRKRTTALQAVTNPETEAQRRAKKNDSKMKNRKRKNESYKETKLKYGVMSRGKRARQD